MHYLRTAITALVVGATASQAAVSKVTRQGKYLYDATGARFFIKVSFGWILWCTRKAREARAGYVLQVEQDGGC